MRLLKKRRAVVIAVVVVVVGGAGTAAYALTRSSTSSGSAAGYQLVAASTGDLQQTVASTGTIEPKQDEDLSFSVSGTITAVKASVGQKVAKGAVLATVDTTTLQATVDTAQAAVTAAQLQVTAAAAESTTQQASAAAQLAAAQNTLTQAQTALAGATLKAPFAGTVAAVTMETGDVVGSSSGGAGGGGGGSNQSAASSSSSTTDTVTLISTDSWVVNASVGSADLAQLAKGQQVQITPSGATQRVFGTIASVGIVASSTSGTSATFPVVVDVTGTPTGLYAGGSATLTFIVKSVTGVLTVPTLALHTDNGKTVVYLHNGSSRVVTPVTVGQSYGASTEITAGIKSGDKVEVTVPTFGGRTGTTTRNRTRTGTTTGGGFGGFGGGGFGGGGAGGFTGGGAAPGGAVVAP